MSITRTKRDIKQALIKLLGSKSRDEITMSELAREAGVSRSTLYLHYGNVFEAYTDLIGDFVDRAAPVIDSAACFEKVQTEGKEPFCELVRKEDNRNLTNSPCFLTAFMDSLEPRGNPAFINALTDAGYPPEVVQALVVFQMNGCFNAIKQYGGNDATWCEVREAIDTFICGGLNACCERKRHETHKKM